MFAFLRRLFRRNRESGVVLTTTNNATTVATNAQTSWGYIRRDREKPPDWGHINYPIPAEEPPRIAYAIPMPKTEAGINRWDGPRPKRVGRPKSWEREKLEAMPAGSTTSFPCRYGPHGSHCPGVNVLYRMGKPHDYEWVCNGLKIMVSRVK